MKVVMSQDFTWANNGSTFNIIFNESGDICNIKKLQATCTIDGGSISYSFRNNKYG